MLDEEGKVIVGIVNQEHETVSYRIGVEVRIDRVGNNEVKTIVLEHAAKWESEVSFVPKMAGENQEVQLLLYRNEDTEPCFKPLHSLINVTE